MIPKRILKALHHSAVVERDGHFTLFLQGEKPIGLWMVESGRLCVSRVSNRGRTVVLDVLEAGDLAGLAATVAAMPYETSAETAEPCRLRLLPQADFARLIERDAGSALAVATLLAGEVAAAHRWIGDTMLLRTSRERLVNLLLSADRDELAELTHEDLANRIGISRECVTRLVQTFKAAGAIAPDRGALLVRSRAILKGLAA